MGNDRNRDNDRGGDQDRNRTDPYDSLANIHKDVHGIRRQLLDAIGSVEQSQTRMISTLTNILARIESKIDKLGTGGTTPAEEARMRALTIQGAALVARLKTIDAER